MSINLNIVEYKFSYPTVTFVVAVGINLNIVEYKYVFKRKSQTGKMSLVLI